MGQIGGILSEMGYDPLVYDFSFTKEVEKFFIHHPEQLVYRYLESGFPVIVSIDTDKPGIGHTMVIIGHTFNPDFWWSQGQILYYGLPPSGFEYHCSTNWIQNFIIQDDNLGPYLFIPANFLKQRVTDITIPLPKGNIFLKGEDAERLGFSLLNKDRFLLVVRDYIKHLEEKVPDANNLYWLKIFKSHLEEKNLVLRTYLKKRATLKEEFNIHDNKFVTNFYKKLEVSNYVWCVEISVPELFCYQRKKIGEILIDPTGSPIPETSYFSIHIPGIIIERNRIAQEMIAHCFEEDDEPTQHLYRSIIPLPL